MTILCWDGTTLAADKRAVSDGLIRTMTKIKRIGDVLVGYAGDAGGGQELYEWVRQGCIAEKYPAQQKTDNWHVFAVVDSRGLKVYEQTPYPIRFEDPFWACGSGRDYAMAAMYLGKSAKEAVAIASHFCSGCGNGVDTLTLEKA